jgi:hypothetical protein
MDRSRVYKKTQPNIPPAPQPAASKENKPKPPPSIRSPILPSRRPALLPEPNPRRWSRRKPAGAKSKRPNAPGSCRGRRELPGAKRKFPAAAGRSQSKKMESGRSGNYPIQKDGIFSWRELPGRGGNFPIQKDGIFFVRQLPNPKRWILFPLGNFPERWPDSRVARRRSFRPDGGVEAFCRPWAGLSIRMDSQTRGRRACGTLTPGFRLAPLRGSKRDRTEPLGTQIGDLQELSTDSRRICLVLRSRLPILGKDPDFPRKSSTSAGNREIPEEVVLFFEVDPCFLEDSPTPHAIFLTPLQSGNFSCKTTASPARRQLPLQSLGSGGKKPNSPAQRKILPREGELDPASSFLRSEAGSVRPRRTNLPQSVLLRRTPGAGGWSPSHRPCYN